MKDKLVATYVSKGGIGVGLYESSNGMFYPRLDEKNTHPQPVRTMSIGKHMKLVRETLEFCMGKEPFASFESADGHVRKIFSPEGLAAFRKYGEG